MALTVSIATSNSIWTLADRQLAADGEIASTDACKVVGLDTSDGAALLSYAGPGLVGGEDPAEWISSVFGGVQADLRGYMTALMKAARSAIPSGARGTSPGHLFVAAGVVDGTPAFYTLVAEPSGKLKLRHFDRASAFMVAGAGGTALMTNREKMAGDARELLGWIKRAETEEAHPREVTDRLAKWNAEARRHDQQVGARAIVTYRFVRDGEAAAGRCFYSGTSLEAPDAKIPHLTRGVDVNKIFDLMKKQAMGASLSPKELAVLQAYKRSEASAGD